MPKPSRALRMAALSVLAAGVASAEGRLELGLDTSLQYDDNIVFSSTNRLSDFLVRTGPRLVLEDEGGQITWRVAYSPTYEKFLRYSEIDGWDQQAEMALSWHVSPRTTLEVHDGYWNLNRYATSLQQATPEGPALDSGVGLVRGRFEQNDAGASLVHLLTWRDQVELSVSHTYTDDRSELISGGNESGVFVGSLGWLRSLDANDRAGLNLSFTQQEIKPQDGRPKASSDFYNLSLQWEHVFDPTLNLQAAVGPALVRSPRTRTDPVLEDQPVVPVIVGSNGVAGPVLIETCPTLDDGTPFLSSQCESLPLGSFSAPGTLLATTDLTVIGEVPEPETSSLTYFATLVLTKQWRAVTTSLRYVRQAGTAVDTTGEVRDLVFANLAWRPADPWLVRWQVSFQRRERANEGLSFVEALGPTGIQGVGQGIGLRAVSVENRISIDQITVSLNVDYRWNRRVTLYSSAYWTEEKVRGDVPFSQSTDRIAIIVGVRFFLDPIPLPI